MIRVATVLTALVGLYPQSRAIRTVLMGKGWIAGDWEKDHKCNNRNLYVIEPLIESLLQVIQDICTSSVFSSPLFRFSFSLSFSTS